MGVTENFFFSSRRRHTRFDCDWSSDVCSSDLAFAGGGDMPGVEIHANALETLVRGNAIREIPQPLSTVLAVMAGLFGAALVVRLRAFRALLAATGFWAILTLGAFGGFVIGDVWIRGMAGTVALVLGYGATVVEHFVREQRERRRLSQFFSPHVLRTVVRASDKLSSRRRLVTVLLDRKSTRLNSSH